MSAINRLCNYTGIYNLFINPKDDFMFCLICKNASSCLKYITLHNNFGQTKVDNTQIYHNTCHKKKLFYYPDGQFYCHPNNDANLFDSTMYKMVYIYRDPFERFVSLYNDKILKKLWFSYKDTGLTQQTSFEDFIGFAKYQIKKAPTESKIEEHIRPQHISYTTRVDYFVPIEKLNNFIKEFDICDDLSIIHSHPHNISEYEKYRDTIYEMYNDDLNLLDLYKDVEYK